MTDLHELKYTRIIPIKEIDQHTHCKWNEGVVVVVVCAYSLLDHTHRLAVPAHEHAGDLWERKP